LEDHAILVETHPWQIFKEILPENPNIRPLKFGGVFGVKLLNL